MVRHNNNRGAGTIGGGGGYGENENIRFLNTYLLYISVNSDFTDTFTYELWVC